MTRRSFQALTDELEKQAGALDSFSRLKQPRARDGSIFVGAGDSHAAAMAGFYASRGKCLALDPYSLASSPEIAEGVDVFLISVSGRTASNIVAARKVRGVAKQIIVITANGGSELAKLADDVITLPMRYAPRTPGILSFTLSLLAVLKASGGGRGGDFSKLYYMAKRDVGQVAWGKETTYFLGNSLGYSAALYATAKTYEFLGLRAHAELLEEFSHTELFALAKPDMVNIFSCFDPSRIARRLSRALGEQGYESHVVPSRGDSPLERLYHAVFVTQISVMARLKGAGLGEPSFLTDNGRLRVSDSMIY